jgi:murein DD-endopeptidase MepM/ murein hydrolase activator NlpD
MTQLTPTELAKFRKLLGNVGEGAHLREKKLVKAIHGIARHHAGKVGNNSAEWLLFVLLLALAGVIYIKFFWQPSQSATSEYQELSNSSIGKSTGSIKVTQPQQVEAPHLIDNSPPGSYDFTILEGNQTKVPVPSPCDGKVKAVRWQGVTGWGDGAWGAGQIVEIKCQGMFYGWLFGHLDKPHVKEGDFVKKGYSIGIQGCTGRCSGDHAHAQIHRQSDWGRIEDRRVTAPIVEAYLQFVRSRQ